MSSNYYEKILIDADIVPTTNADIIPNYLIYFLPWKENELVIKEPLPSRVLRPWEFQPHTSIPKITLFHFSFLNCDICVDDLKEISALQLSKDTPSTLEIVPVIAGTDMTRLIADYVTPHIPVGTKIYLDLEDGLVERFGVMHTPALRFMDEKGNIFGYANNSIDLSSKNFRVFLEILKQWEDIKSKRKYNSFSELLNDKDPPLPAPLEKNFSEISAIHFFLIGIFIIVCYSVMRTIKRR